MKTAPISLILLFSFPFLLSSNSIESSSQVLLSQMQADDSPPLIASNFASVDIDGNFSEWTPDEFHEYDSVSPSDRLRNTAILIRSAMNETHLFGSIEFGDDELFSAFPNTNESKVADIFEFKFHSGRTHDGFACMITAGNFSDALLEAYGIYDGINASISDFTSFPNATLAISDLEFDDEDDVWNVQLLNESIDWINASYESGNYVFWFAKRRVEFEIKEISGVPIINTEFSRDSHYSDGINDPLHQNASFCWSQPFEERLDIYNASGEAIHTLDWASLSPALNATTFSKVYRFYNNRSLSMAFRNSDQEFYVAIEVELPYVNQSFHFCGEDYLPLLAEFYVPVNESVPGETYSTKRLLTTIFNDNVTDLFAGVQAIEDSLGPYPDNVDQGLWIVGSPYPQEFPFAYSADMSAQNKYSIELAAQLQVLNIADFGNGTHGAQVSVGGEIPNAFIRMNINYFNIEDMGLLINRTNEERARHEGVNTAVWRIPSEVWRGSDRIIPEPQITDIVTTLYPIQNVTISQEESQGLAIINARILDEKPFTAELGYKVLGETAKKTLFQVSPGYPGYYYAEIPNLQKGNRVDYNITIIDRFNIRTTTTRASFRFGELSSKDGSVPANLGFLLLCLIVVATGRAFSRRIHD
ncbi:MAG: hypothetical protein ACFFGZ_00005 [Candidatus Thorarchaeota archaeon]